MKSITVTTQQAINYGAVLQCYALQQTIFGHGIENEVLRFPKEPKRMYLKVAFHPSKKALINIGLNLLTFIHRKDLLLLRERFERFKKNNIISTDPVESIPDALYNTPQADFYICGSDQVFSARDALASVRIMDFIRNSVPKYSYAASLAEYDWNDEEREEIRKKLSSYEKISVREIYAKEYLDELLSKQTQVHIDPVFLLTKEQWNKIAANPDIYEPYILCYPLLGHDKLQQTVNQLKELTGYKVVCVQPNPIKRVKADQYIFNAGPREFLGLFKNASYIVTTSFHGTAFSIIFEKPFYTLVKNYKSQRMTDLLSQLHLDSRMILKNVTTETKKPDFEFAKQIIMQECKNSNRYIDDIISTVSKGKKSQQKGQCIDIYEKELCCGCSACSKVCPTNAISMKTDVKGFNYPSIDTGKCINCGKCSAICTFKMPSEKSDNIEVAYAFQHKDCEVLKRSSSGGVFTAVSDYILEKKGAVYGAILNQETFMVTHQRATTKETRDKMCGSKYVQSSIEGIYTGIKKDLKDGKLVLFTGTPCQCAAISSFIVNVPENLYILEILCYGAPSNKLLIEHIRMWESKSGRKIANYNYRSKKYGYEHTHEIEFIDGERNSCIDVARLLKLYSYSVRPSCYECRYDNRHRYGDLTVGDMWDAGKRAQIFDHRGTSLLTVNSTKGCLLLNGIRPNCNIKKINIELKGYRPLKYPLTKPKKVNQFWQEYCLHGYEYVLNKYAKVRWTSKLYRSALRVAFFLHMDRLIEHAKAR